MKALSLIVAIIVLIAAFKVSTFITTEYTQALKIQFGKPIGKPIIDPGLHFKKPLIQNIKYLDKRILEWDGDPNQIPTKDKKYILVDVTARWKIVDALKFYQTVRTENGAHTRLDDVIDGATRNVVSNHFLVEVVRNTNSILESGVMDIDLGEMTKLEKINFGRETLTQEIFNEASNIVPQYGIKLVDVMIKRISYEDTVQQKVFERMISERKMIAEKFRSEGKGKKAEILGRTEKKVRSIKSEAYKKAQEIKGKADATVTNIYAKAYNRGRDFYKFLRTMESYNKAIKKDSYLFLSTENEYLKYLNKYR